MELTKLIFDLLKGIAWPTAFLLAVMILKKPIVQLIPLIGKLKYKDLELEFRKELAEAEKESVPATNNLPEETVNEIERSRNHLHDIATKSPQAAIMESWRLLELKLSEIAKSSDFEFEAEVFKRPIVMGGLLLGHGILTDDQYDSIQRLRRLRNEVAHNEDLSISTTQAMSYIDVTLKTMAGINRNLLGQSMELP